MRKNVCMLIVLLAIASATSGTLKAQTKPGTENDAILKVVKTEASSYADKNFETWKNQWYHSDYTNWAFASSFGFREVTGWDSIEKLQSRHFTSNEPSNKTVIQKNNVLVDGNTALVEQDVIVNADGASMPYAPMKGKSSIYLKKIEGSWKITGMYLYNISGYEASDLATESAINMSGYKLLQSGKTDDAIKLFTLNTEIYPDSFNVWDSLAEAYMEKGEKAKATEYYKKSLKLNSKNTNATKMLEKLQTMK